MTTLNALATLADYKAWFTMRGGSTSTDTADDAVIELLLKELFAMLLKVLFKPLIVLLVSV